VEKLMAKLAISKWKIIAITTRGIHFIVIGDIPL
jgi:hypothetical protein